MGVKTRLVAEDRILNQIRGCFSMFRCVKEGGVHPRGVVYASSPITTGIRLYDLMRQIGVSDATQQEFKSHHLFKPHVMDPNLADGQRFGEWLRAQGYQLVIIPGIFFVKGWAQGHYMSLWSQVIKGYADVVALNEGWQWSNGCVAECAVAIEAKKKLLNHRGEVIRDHAALANLVRKAIDTLDKQKLDTARLYELWRQMVLAIDLAKAKERDAFVSD